VARALQECGSQERARPALERGGEARRWPMGRPRRGGGFHQPRQTPAPDFDGHEREPGVLRPAAAPFPPPAYAVERVAPELPYTEPAGRGAHVSLSRATLVRALAHRNFRPVRD